MKLLNRMLKLKLFSTLFLVFILIQIVEAQVSCGETITQNTILTEDLTNCPGTGIIIGANNIGLNCNGHKITGIEALYQAGIYISSYSNITIENCDVENFDNGLFIYASDDSVIKNNSVNVTQIGLAPRSLSLVLSNRNTITNNVFDGPAEVATSNSNLLENNEFISKPPYEGLSIYGDGNAVKNNIIRGLGDRVGINMPNYATNNTILNNTITLFNIGDHNMYKK